MLAWIKSQQTNIVKYLFYIEFYIIHFGLNTTLGRFLFIFSFIVMQYGLNPSIPNWLKVICTLYASEQISSTLLIYFLQQVPISRDYLYNLQGKEFIISIVGNPGGNAVKSLVTSIGIATAALVGSEIASTAIDTTSSVLQNKANATNYIEAVRQAGGSPDIDVIGDIFKSKPEPKSIATRVIDSLTKSLFYLCSSSPIQKAAIFNLGAKSNTRSYNKEIYNIIYVDLDKSLVVEYKC